MSVGGSALLNNFISRLDDFLKTNSTTFRGCEICAGITG